MSPASLVVVVTPDVEAEAKAVEVSVDAALRRNDARSVCACIGFIARRSIEIGIREAMICFYLKWFGVCKRSETRAFLLPPYLHLPAHTIHSFMLQRVPTEHPGTMPLLA